MACKVVPSSSNNINSSISSCTVAQNPWAHPSWSTAPTEQEEQASKTSSTTDARWTSLGEEGRIGFERFVGTGVGRGGQASIAVGYGIRAQLMAVKNFHGKISEREFRKYEGMYEILKSAKPECRLLEIFSYERVPANEGMTRLVTAYCEGENLYDFLRRHEKAELDVPEAFIWTVFNDMVRALAFLQLGEGCKLPIMMKYPIIHRDIKPDNIMIVGANMTTPHCKLVDFDLATYFDQDAMQSSSSGTANWNPPEQWEDFEVAYPTPAGDIWALGAVIHFLATREGPADLCVCTPEYCPGEKYCGAHGSSKYSYGDRSEEMVMKIQTAIDECENGIERRRLKHKFRCKAMWRIDVPSPDEDEAYSPRLSSWMLACLAQRPEDRITVRRLYDAMLDGKLEIGDRGAFSSSGVYEDGFRGFVYNYPKLWELGFQDAVQIDPKKEFGKYEVDAAEDEGRLENGGGW